MTVKIVDPNPDPSIIKNVICKMCGVKLSYVPNDIDKETTSCCGDSTTRDFITCANCKHKIVLRSY